jgi:hypothetical protein
VGGTGGAAPVEGAGGQWAKSPSQAVVMVGGGHDAGVRSCQGQAKGLLGFPLTTLTENGTKDVTGAIHKSSRTNLAFSKVQGRS